MNDNEIINSIIEGNINNYRFIVDKYKDVVFRTCLGYVHDSSQADDLTQEVFISAYKSLSGFKGNSSLSTWLFRIAVNKSLNHLRSAKSEKRGNLMKDFFSLSQKNESTNIRSAELLPDELLIQKEKHDRVNHALSKLPENQRTAIILSKYNDLSQKEIAEILDKSEGAIEALLQRAKENLRKYLIEKNKTEGKK